MNRKERTILVTLFINTLVIGFKFWLAAASGSLALQASALHSVADAVIAFLVLVGLFVLRWDSLRTGSALRASIIENWVALLVAAAIFYVGLDIVAEVIRNEPPELRNLGPVTVAVLVTLPIAYFLARYLQYVGQQTDSPALRASGFHAYMDIYTSIVAVAGLVGAALGIANLDRAAAAVVVVFILFSGYEIASAALTAIRHRSVLELEAGTHTHSPTPGIWRTFLPVTSVILLTLFLLSGLYTVHPGQVAVVRRFGQVLTSNVGPGLHYRLPWPIERVEIVTLEAVRRSESAASLMLTGDENQINVRLSVHYRVRDPAAFLLNVVDPEMLVTQTADAALRQVVANEAVDTLLTIDKELIEQRAIELAQTTLDGYGAGIQVLSILLLESSPPPEVADAFRDVASAGEDRNTFINEALAYQNEILPVARGDAETTIQSANAYRAEKLALAASDTTQFARQQSAYANAPDVTRLRLYLEAIERVLPNVRKFIIDTNVRLESTDLWIPGAGMITTFPPIP